MATARPSNLQVAVWLRHLEHLAEFTTTTLEKLGIEQLDTPVVDAAVKGPGSRTCPGDTVAAPRPPSTRMPEAQA